MRSFWKTNLFSRSASDVFSFDIRPLPSNSNNNSSNHPFSVILFVNGIRDLRINTCCPHKHRPGTRLSPDFTLVDVVGGRPCFACQNNSNSRFSTSFDGVGDIRGVNSKIFLDIIDAHQDQDEDDRDETWFAVKAAIESAEAALAATEKRIEGLLLDDDNDDDGGGGGDGGELGKIKDENHNTTDGNQTENPSQSLSDDGNAVIGKKEEELVVAEEEEKESLHLVDEMAEEEEEEEEENAESGQNADHTQTDEKLQQQSSFTAEKIKQDEIQLKTADDDIEEAAAKVTDEDEKEVDAVEELIEEKDDSDNDKQKENNSPTETTMPVITSNDEVIAEEEEAEEDDDEGSSLTTTTSSTITTLIQLAYNLDEKREEEVKEEDVGDITEETLPVEMQLLPENGLDSDDDRDDTLPTLPVPPLSSSTKSSTEPSTS